MLMKVVIALVVWVALASPAWAYTLPAPELMGQFLALAAWAGVAFASMLMYPVYAATRYFWGRAEPKAAPQAQPAADSKNEQG
jgi:hypothetical protein